MDFFRRLTSLIILLLLFDCAFSFPDGAPAEACDSLLPRHSGTLPSPIAESPYIFVASDDKYSYNNPQTIKVEIYGSPFKGFLVAAIDPFTRERIGNWIKGTGTGTLPCAAITHSDGRDKSHVTLYWTPQLKLCFRSDKNAYVRVVLRRSIDDLCSAKAPLAERRTNKELQ